MAVPAPAARAAAIAGRKRAAAPPDDMSEEEEDPEQLGERVKLLRSAGKKSDARTKVWLRPRLATATHASSLRIICCFLTRTETLSL